MFAAAMRMKAKASAGNRWTRSSRQTSPVFSESNKAPYNEASTSLNEGKAETRFAKRKLTCSSRDFKSLIAGMASFEAEDTKMRCGRHSAEVLPTVGCFHAKYSALCNMKAQLAVEYKLIQFYNHFGWRRYFLKCIPYLVE